MEKIHKLSKETKLDRLKSAYQLSVSLQNLSESYSNSFDSDLNKFTNIMASTLEDETGNSINVNDSNLTTRRNENVKHRRLQRQCVAGTNPSKMYTTNGMGWTRFTMSTEAPKVEKNNLGHRGERIQ